MSLVEDIRLHYTEEKSPPDGPDLDYELVDGQWVKKDTETRQVSYEVVDDTPRWGDLIQVVFERDGTYVAVQDVRPGTEYQDWGDYGDPSIFEVEPYNVTVTKYKKV